MQKKIIFITLLLVVVFASCKKDPIAPAKTRTELLLHGGVAWKITAATVDPPYPAGKTLITDFYAQLDNCDKDNTYLYSANPVTATSGSFTEFNPVKCGASEDSSHAGTWSFNGDDLVTSNGTETILSIDETVLKTKQVISSGGINYTLTITYK